MGTLQLLQKACFSAHLYLQLENGTYSWKMELNAETKSPLMQISPVTSCHIIGVFIGSILHTDILFFLPKSFLSYII